MPLTPIGPVGAYVTYGITARPDTGERAACKDVGCEAYRAGWESIFDEATDLGREQASYVRHRSGREFTESRTAAGLTVFRFTPFQRCFADHGTKRDLFTVRDGDWRGNPTGRRRVHVNGRDWIEDLQEHEGALTDLRKKG